MSHSRSRNYNFRSRYPPDDYYYYQPYRHSLLQIAKNHERFNLSQLPNLYQQHFKKPIKSIYNGKLIKLVSYFPDLFKIKLNTQNNNTYLVSLFYHNKTRSSYSRSHCHSERRMHTYQNRSRYRSRRRSRRRSYSRSRSRSRSYSSYSTDSNSPKLTYPPLPKCLLEKQINIEKENTVIQTGKNINTNDKADTKPLSISKTEFPSTIGTVYYPVGYALAVAFNNKLMNKSYKNATELLEKYDMFHCEHIALLQQINDSYWNVNTVISLNNVCVCGNSANLWLNKQETIWIKIKANTQNEWNDFVKQNVEFMYGWICNIIGYNWLDYICKDTETFTNCPKVKATFCDNIKMFLKGIENIIEIKSVNDWNCYGIIYWLNRVNNGILNGFEYWNLRRHIVVGKVCGNQLCHLNDVTLKMIGIYDENKVRLILDLISELISDNSYNNLMANVLLTDMIPDSYCDPVSFELMNDPVMVESCGNIYEREFIEKYIGNYNKDPLTQKSVYISEIISCDDLKCKINAWTETYVLRDFDV
eukprot:203000_1